MIYGLAPLFRDDGLPTYKGTLYEWLGVSATGAIWDPLPAGSTENQLMFSYHVGTNMAGGQVKFNLPTGWKILTTAANVRTPADEASTDDPKPDSFTGDAYERYGDNFLIEILEDFDGSDGRRMQRQ